nr:FtsK/SpoIIIE domain-containing protein [uncultured Butyrivibrio sp.]
MIWGYHDYGTGALAPVPIKLNIQDHCHALITGSTGSGKSYALMFLIGCLLKASPETEIFICDFKNSEDFRFLKDYPLYFTGENCYAGVMAYYRKFTDARETGKTHIRRILIFDEYPAYTFFQTMKDKDNKTKYSSDITNVIATILMLGRGLKHGVWLVTQRADASLFANGARDNFQIIIGLGRLSKEQKAMIFTGEEIPNEPMQRGEGYLLADGHALKKVKYPLITNINDWKWHIYDILMRNIENNIDSSQSTPLA